jgi:hypothetical protein
MIIKRIKVKRSNISIIILLSCLSVYLLYKLLIIDEFNKLDYILLIFLTIIGFTNSFIIYIRRKKKTENSD